MSGPASRAALSRLSPGHVMQIGQVHSNGKWTLSANRVRFPELMSVVNFVAENHLQLSNVVPARVGMG
eukprot:9452052-Lingulodinium_polyedra.AAC.1